MLCLSTKEHSRPFFLLPLLTQHTASLLRPHLHTALAHKTDAHLKYTCPSVFQHLKIAKELFSLGTVPEFPICAKITLPWMHHYRVYSVSCLLPYLVSKTIFSHLTIFDGGRALLGAGVGAGMQFWTKWISQQYHRTEGLRIDLLFSFILILEKHGLMIHFILFKEPELKPRLPITNRDSV